MPLPTLAQLRSSKEYLNSDSTTRSAIEQQYSADSQQQGGSGFSLPGSGITRDESGVYKGSGLPQAVGIDTAAGLPSEMVYRQAEREKLPRTGLPAFDDAVPVADSQPERTMLGTGQDIGATLMGGFSQVPKAVTGLADIVTGGHAGRLVEKTLPAGFGDEYWRSKLSPAQRYAESRVQQAKGFVPTLKAGLQNPSVIARSVGESIPSMLAGGAIGRGVAALVPRLAGVTAGAIGEGVISAGALAEDIRQDTENRLLTPKQAAAAVGAGIGTGLFSVVGGRLAQKLGIDDIDTLLAGGKFQKPDQVAKAIIAGGVSEGLFEEMPQEMQEAVWQNAATGRPLLEGAAEAGAQALLAGAAMGSGANVLSRAAGQAPLPEDEGEATRRETAAGILPDTATAMLDEVVRAINTGQLDPADPAKTEIINSVREQMRAVADHPDSAVQEAVRKNIDVLERFGVVKKPAAKPSEPAKVEKAGSAEVDLIRAKSIPEEHRTQEEKEIIKNNEKEILKTKQAAKQAETEADREEKTGGIADQTALRRAQALPDDLRTEDERVIIRDEDRRVGTEPGAEQSKAARQITKDFAELSFEEGQVEIRRILAKPEAERTDGEKYTAGVVQVEEKRIESDRVTAEKQIKREAEEVAEEHPAHTSMTRAIQEGGINIDLARKEGWDIDTMKDVRRPGLFSKNATMGPDEMAQTLGYESEEAMKDEWHKAPTKKELVSGGIAEAEGRQIAIAESADQLEKEGFDLGSEQKVSVGELNPGDEVVVTSRDGVPDKLTHKGYDGQGNALLQDGVLIKADPFEEIEILAKKTGDTETGGKIQKLFSDLRENTDTDNIKSMLAEIPEAIDADPKLKPYSELIKASLERRLSELSDKKPPAPPAEKVPKAKKEGDGKELLEPITGKEDTPQLGTEKRTRYLGEQETRTAPIKSKRKQITKAKKFQEERRDPKKHKSITTQREYKGKLPSNTERLMDITADRYRDFNNAKASVDENKEHLVKLFDKAGTGKITVEVGGQEFTIKKPVLGKEQIVMNRAGRDALDTLKQKYKDAGLLTFDYDRGGILMVQPSVAGKSKAAAYGPKTLEAAAIEHVGFMQDLAESNFQKDAARKRVKEQVVSKLDDRGIDHAWANQKRNAVFWVERAAAKKEFATTEAKERYGAERVEAKEAPEFIKKKKRKLGTAGVSEAKALGLKRGEKAKRASSADTELDQILKSISGTPLPKGQRADIIGELTKQLGRSVLAQQKRGVFEIVSPERAAGAFGIIGGIKKSITAWHGTPFSFPAEARIKDEKGKIVARFAKGDKRPSETVVNRLRSGEYNLEVFSDGRFRSDKIKMNEGAYGWGHYLAELEVEAEGYKREYTGALYKVKVDLDNDSSELLDWEKTIDDQPESVKKFITDIGFSIQTAKDLAYDGSGLYSLLGKMSDIGIKNDADVSALLLMHGIKGVKFKSHMNPMKANYVIFDEEMLTIEAKYSKDGQRLEGLNFPDGKVWLIEGNIEKGAAAGVLAHELGVHARKLGFKDEKSFQTILKRIEAISETDDQVKAARKRVPDGTPAQNVNEETLAYLVSDAPQHNLIRRLYSAIKKFLAERGWARQSIDKLTPADLQAMAQSAIRRIDTPVIDRAAEGVNEFAQSAKMSTTKAADAIKGLANFKKWFGDSQVVDEDGEPLVVYHGSDAKFTEFNVDEVVGAWFTPNKKIAKNLFGRKKKNVLPVYLNLRNPYIIETTESKTASLENDAWVKLYYEFEQGKYLEKAGNKGWMKEQYLKEDLIKKGHDGIILKNSNKDTDIIGGIPTDQIIVFNQSQIKSIHNTGEWSAIDPDIMKSVAVEKAGTAKKQPSEESGRLSMSAPARQSRRNTENLNATKDGETSKSSAEAGSKAIKSIMETLRKIGKETEAELYKSKAKEQKFLDRYRKTLENPDLTVEDGTSLLSDFVRQSDVPGGTKQRIGQLIKQITSAKRPETQQKRLTVALEKLEADISKRLKIKIRNQIKRAAGPKLEGVIKRGRYWHEQEKDMSGIRDAVYMSADKAEAAITGTEAKLDRLLKHLEGADPDKAAPVRGRITDAEAKLHHLKTFGNLTGKSIDELLSAKFQADEIRAMGRSKLRAVNDEWRKNIDRKTGWLAKEITGQDEPKRETLAERNRRQGKERKLTGKVKGAYSAVENSILSWEFILDKLAAKGTGKALQSRAVEELGSLAHAGQRDVEKFNRDSSDKILNKGLEIFGVKKGKNLTGKLQKLSKKTEKIRVAGDELQVSPLEAAYLYIVKREAGSENAFRESGFTAESFQDIDKILSPELKEWADYLQDDLLAGVLDGETKAYRAVNGVDRKPVGLFRDGQAEISIMNLNSAVLNRVYDANHYRAWAVPSKTFNGIFTDPEIRGYINQHTGPGTLKAVDNFLEDFAKSPKELRGDMAWMDKLRSNVVMSMLGANPTTFFKQLTSVPAYAADIQVAAFVANFAHGLANFRKVKRLIGSSSMAKERFGTGFDRDIHDASKATAEQVIGGRVTRVRDVLMSMTKLGDKAAIYAGYTVYKYHYDKAKSAEMTDSEAHEIGIRKFEIATERTQQAGATKDLGSFQRGSSLQKLFTMYMTSPAAYTRQTMSALRHFKTDPIGSSKRLMIFNIMLPMMFQSVASGFLGAGGGDEDEWADFWQKEMRAVALGPFLGVPIARDIAAGIWESGMGSWYGSDVSHSPVTETTKSLTQAVFQASKGLREGDEEALERAKGDLIDFLGYISGLPTRPGRRLWEGWDDFLSGDTDHPFLAMSGYSRYARKEKHLDE
jgi:hypothetical protein